METHNRVFCRSSSLSKPRKKHVRPSCNPFIIQTLLCLSPTSIIVRREGTEELLESRHGVGGQLGRHLRLSVYAYVSG